MSPDDHDFRREAIEALIHLPEQDRVVIILHYFENLALAELGEVLGLTRSRVDWVRTRAVLRLRVALREQADIRAAIGARAAGARAGG